MDRVIFVYGTLRRADVNHEVLENSEFIGEGNIKGYEVYNLPYGYPYLKECRGNNKGYVKGEYYIVSEDVEKEIDDILRYKGKDNQKNLFNKVEEDFFYTKNGGVQKAKLFYYIWNGVIPKNIEKCENNEW